MIFIYKITEVKFCMSLRNYHNANLTANDAAAYSDDSLIRTRLFLVDIAGLTSFPDY